MTGLVVLSAGWSACGLAGARVDGADGERRAGAARDAEVPTVPYVETKVLDADALAQVVSDLVARTDEPRVRYVPAGSDRRSCVQLTPASPGADGEACFTSAWQASTHPFRDLLVSWNVDAPPGTSFRVEVCVEAEDAPASPWLTIGEWGTPPASASTITCDGGRVDVDCFRGEREFRRARVRVRAFLDVAAMADARLGARALQLSRLAWTFSDRTRRVEDRSIAPAESSWKRRLDVPFRSQRTERPEIAGRICSPTSLSMVLAYRGVDRPVGEVAARAFDAPHDIYGNWPRNVQTAWSYGVPGYVTRVASWREVEALVAAGTPVIASIGVKPGQLGGAPYTQTDGHLIVITGFDERGDVCVNDPAASDAEHGVVVYRRADMQTVWLDRGGTCYVLEAR